LFWYPRRHHGFQTYPGVRLPPLRTPRGRQIGAKDWYIETFSLYDDGQLIEGRFLHLDILLFDVFHELSGSFELGKCVCEWDERGVGVQGKSV
jgi:hypothetical protein